MRVPAIETRRLGAMFSEGREVFPSRLRRDFLEVRYSAEKIERSVPVTSQVAGKPGRTLAAAL